MPANQERSDSNSAIPSQQLHNLFGWMLTSMIFLPALPHPNRFCRAFPMARALNCLNPYSPSILS